MNCKQCGKDCDPGVKCWNCETFNEDPGVLNKKPLSEHIKLKLPEPKPKHQFLPRPGPHTLIDPEGNVFDIFVSDLKFDPYTNGFRMEAILQQEAISNWVVRRGEVKTIDNMEVDIPGIRVVGKWPSITISVQDKNGEWVELDKVYKLRLLLDATDKYKAPTVQIERYVSLESYKSDRPISCSDPEVNRELQKKCKPT